MSTMCTRCALRLQRAAAADTQQTANRAFSQSTNRRKHHGIPTFTDSPNPELNDVLLSMRTKHFIPSYLPKSDRRLIFGTKNRQLLADNPQTSIVHGEEIPLTWMDRRSEIPNRAKLFNQAIELMQRDAEGKGWVNLPALLTGMKHGKAVSGLSGAAMGRVVRKAGNRGKLGIVIQCLQQVENTGMTLKDRDVLENVIRQLHGHAQRNQWSEEATSKALKWAGEVALLSEKDEHGGGKLLKGHDVRRRPEIIGVFLELAAVSAYKFREGKDVDGKVKMYAERLLACIGEQTQPPTRAPAAIGPQLEMLHGVPIWHGLLLAEKILGADLPNAQKAQKIREDYEAGLTILAQALEAQRPKEGSYGAQALRVWRECIRQ